MPTGDLRPVTRDQFRQKIQGATELPIADMQLQLRCGP
jgi:hypothetical protein